MKNDYFNQILVFLKLNDEAKTFYEYLFAEFAKSDFINVRDLFYVSKIDDLDFLEKISSDVKLYQNSTRKANKKTLYEHLVFMFFQEKETKEYKEQFNSYFEENYNAFSNDALNILKVSKGLIDLVSDNISLENVMKRLEELHESFKNINKLKDQAIKTDLTRIGFRYILRSISREENKVDFLIKLLDLRDDMHFDKNIKCFYVEATKPLIIKNIKDLITLTTKLEKEVYYRGHADTSYTLIPSVFRGTMFQYEEDVIKTMELEIPEEFSNIPTHYDKLLKMQHYGIPTRLLDITTNPLVAAFMACDSQPDKDGEIIMIDKDSFETCYPSSDKIKILSSISFLPYDIKLVLRFFLYITPVSDSVFNIISKPLIHEIKHEMPSFEPRIKLEDLKKHLFVLGPKSNRRIYAQSGHFIVSPLKKNVKDDVPVQLYEEKGFRTRVYILRKNKSDIIKELESLNIKRHTMYPEIENVAVGVKKEYL